MNILSINEVDCKDCYKCVRHCPVNAIKIKSGHASVDSERCILCGKCYGICPQNAKVVRSDIEKAKNLLKDGKSVIASISPSFFAYYNPQKAGKILSALKILGFAEIEQTSRAVRDVSNCHLDLYTPGENIVISSSCPVIVNLIEKYYPELIQHLAPVLSPAAAHSKLIKNDASIKNAAVVFISPCIAKKEELEASDVDVCLTFQEVESWIEQESIDVNKLQPIDFNRHFSKFSCLFPLLGGLIKKVGLEENSFSKETLSVSGINEVTECLNLIKNKKIKTGFIDLLSCKEGCVSGPCRPISHIKDSPIELKFNLVENLKDLPEKEEITLLNQEDLYRTYKDRSTKLEIPTEKHIKAILALTGKYTEDDEHNCGACGYETCRNKAIAVIHGMAEAEMCIPYMKQQAEKFTSIVIKNTPNGIILLDKDLKIIEVNPAFEKIVDKQSDNLIGNVISEIMDDEQFVQINLEEETVSKSTIILNGKKINKIIYSIPDKKQIAAIFIDVSDIEAQKDALKKTKQETLTRAQAVINKQMMVAQEIAGLLGESTAETKVLLGQLMKTLSEE